MNKFLTVISLLFLPVLPLVAQQPMASLDRNEIRIGEQVYLTLSIPAELAAGKKIIWPRLTDTINAHVEVLDSVIDLQHYTKKYLITSFDSGAYQLPAFPFHVDSDSVLSNVVTLYVNTVKVDTTKAIKAIKTIQGVNSAAANAWYSNIWIITGIVLLVAALVFFIWWRKKRKKQPVQEGPPPVILPLHEQLLMDLDALEQQKLWQNNQVKQYYVALTDILRAYIEKRYQVMALEQTTIQLVNNLRTSSIHPEALQLLRNILELADMVKFAKAVPDVYENQALMDNARHFALLTKVKEESNLG